MKILDRLVKKLFTFRKIMWLFLCGMLVISKTAVAQQTDQSEKGSSDSGWTSKKPLMIKYGPPPSMREKISNDQKPNGDPAAKKREEMKRQYELNASTTEKYGSPSSIKCKIINTQPPSAQPAKRAHVKKHHKAKKTNTKAVDTAGGNRGQ
jgi:hypothetical protein